MGGVDAIGVRLHFISRLDLPAIDAANATLPTRRCQHMDIS
jgi:hypothetical protein